jgi:transcriptional regulator with XRE-family HTH domain
MNTLYSFERVLSTTVAAMESDSFSAWLRRRLLDKDWSQAEFARRVGASTGVVNSWYHGKRRPETESIDKIADVLGADVDLLLTLAGHRPATEPIDPDDPVERICGLLRRAKLDAMQLDAIEKLATNFRDWNRQIAREAKERKGRE